MSSWEPSIRPPSPTSRRFASLAEADAWYRAWLQDGALPLWAQAGVDDRGGAFREGLTWGGAPVDPRRRARVQARQVFVYATAAADGLDGPWRQVAERGFEALRREWRRSDGLYVSAIDAAGAPTDPVPRLYEHAFILLALESLHRLEVAGAADEAAAILELLGGFRHAAGGFREAGEEPFQANAQMHLFEAALFWERAGGGHRWAALADEMAALAMHAFIDPTSGALYEFFDADWKPLRTEAPLIEPGHQFEWAWLLSQWGAARGEPRAQAAARRLFEVGRSGVQPGRDVAANTLWPDLRVRDAGARLWPQTEHLKAALVLARPGAALQAAEGLAAYLDTPVRGVWRERMRADGGFIEEPSPATSFYHLFLAIRELARFADNP